MPCTPQMLEEAALCGREFRLISFAASPTRVTPGQAVTLRWDIQRSGPCPGQFKLNGVTVPMDGSKVVNPISDAIYTLTFEGRCNITRNLGRLTIDVDDSACRIFNIPESEVRDRIIQAVDRSIEDYNQSGDNDLSKRRETVVQVDNQGISINLRLKAAINNFADPDLDVDMKIGLGVGPGNTVSVFYRSFSVDVDWPWWVTGISLGITKIIEEIVEDMIEDKMKNLIINSLRQQISDAAAQLPGTLTSIRTLQDELRLQIC